MRLLYSYKNVKKYICLKVLMKVKVSLEGFIFPLLSYLTIFTRQSHFLLVFLVLLNLVEAFNKKDNLSCMKWGKKFTEYSDIPLLIGWCKYNQILGTKEKNKEKRKKTNSKDAVGALYSGLFDLSLVYS